MSTTHRIEPSATETTRTVEGWIDKPASDAGSPPPTDNKQPAVATRARHLVIRASAGSGKTYQLVTRYLRKLFDGVPVEQILASTFTRKAAGEILGRILLRLSQASRDKRECETLASDLGADNLDRDRCLQLLQLLARSLHHMRVSTLDSFFSRLATSYTLELGLPPGWEITDELADQQLRRQAIEQILRDETTDDTRRLMNLLSKGGAGRSVSGLIQQTVDNFYDVFRRTDRGAWYRFPDLIPLSAQQLAAAIEDLRTLELPTHKSIRLYHQRDVECALAGDWETFVTKCGHLKKINDGDFTYYSHPIADATRDCYLRLQEHARAIEIKKLAGRTASTYELLASFDLRYRQLKHETRGLRFDDVTDRLADALSDDRSQAALPELAYRLDSDVAHLLLDEFQDTSLTQWQVMSPFAERITQAERGTSFFCVGDVKQAIYGWRGGIAEIFDAIEGQLDGIDSATLAQSRRSSQVVIDVVNELFANIPRHSNLKQDEETVRNWCAAVEPHTTALDIPGYVTLETGPGIDDDDSQGVTDLTLDYTAERVQQITQANPDVTVGVLVRKNKNIPWLISRLRELGVDASEEAGNPLTDSAATIVILSLLRMADHPGDTIARFHVATSPLGEAIGYTQHANHAAAAMLAADIRRSLVDDGYGATIEGWARLLIPDCTARDLKRLGQLVDMAYRYGEQSTLRPTDFVRFVESEKVNDPTDARVRVMSVHQSKGLQFGVVVLPLVDGGLISQTPKYFTGRPSPYAPADLVSLYCPQEREHLLPPEFQAALAETKAADVREELCILYVAVTRAQHALHMIVPPRAKESSLPKSLAGFVRAGLTDGQLPQPLQTLFEHGDPDWATKLGASTVRQSTADTTTAEPDRTLRVRLAEMTDGRSRGLGRVAPSQTATSQVRLSQLVMGPQSAALDRGSLMHAWFEQIEWLDAGPLDEQRLRRIGQRLAFEPDEIERHLEEFRRMLQRSAVVELLSRRSYLSLNQPPVSQPIVDELTAEPFTLDVERERRVATRLEGDLLTGAIDRLVLLRRGYQVIAADIIDYKTDAVASGQAGRHEPTAHYRRQLESYAAAIGCNYRLTPQRITARLLFVESGDVITV